MKQIIDKSDNQPVIPLVVQPKISPDSDNALYEKDNGLKVDKQQPVTRQLTLINGATTTEPHNCTYTKIGNICIVNIAAVTITTETATTLASNLPKALTRANDILGATNIILYVNTGSTNLSISKSITKYYGQLIYACE